VIYSLSVNLDRGPAILTERFAHALQLAFQLHQFQLRKGADIPYIAHLLGVTAIVFEDGGDEDQAIAALLHDAVEDQGGRPTLELIRQQFGDRVAGIVDGLTDSYDIPKPPWLERKQQYLDHLRHASPEVTLVSMADKIHNARTILAALNRLGESTWERFNGGKEGTLWYYKALCQAFADYPDTFRLGELNWLVAEMERLANQSSSPMV
jgi:(p)ppGpp synthase/HD superfamily hydrolase